MDLREELKSAGTYPTGPCSAWPQHRNEQLAKAYPQSQERKVKHATKVKASFGDMAKNLAKSSKMALNGKVSKEIREERYDTCKNCPAFIEKSKRCSECGCFMEAKTWLKADPNELCPLKKWAK